MTNRGRIIFFGLILGAATGLIAALLLNQRAEKEGRSTAMTAGEGLKLGVLLLGLLRAIGSLGEEPRKK
jgi:DMSO reductase anchor subunit